MAFKEISVKCPHFLCKKGRRENLCTIENIKSPEYICKI